MRDRNRYEHEDRAALLELMARAWWSGCDDPPHADPWDAANVAQRADVLGHCAGLYAGRLAPTHAGDLAALAILQPGPNDGEPVTDEERANMAVCSTCGGRRKIGGFVGGKFAAAVVNAALELTEPCPDCAKGQTP